MTQAEMITLNNIINSYNEPSDEVQIISSKDWYTIVETLNKQN